MKVNFTKGEELLALCNHRGVKISEIMIEREMFVTGRSRDEILTQMKESLSIMKNAINKGLKEDIKSVSGLIGGDAKKLKSYYENKKTASGSQMNKAVASAMAVLEVNASMGLIVAAPTAGASGILPGALISVGEDFSIKDEEITLALFTGGAIGYLITKNASVSGAEGGCQAETGSAAAMAAAGIVEILGGSPSESLDAAAMTIKNILGLVCDPIAGLVEAPCLKRNAIGTANALICADMALAGIKSIVPFDEVVYTMFKVGKALPPSLRETAEGGLAVSPTGLRIKNEIFADNK